MVKINELLKKTDLTEAERVSITWLWGRIQYFMEHKSIPGALNKQSYDNTALFKPGEMYMYFYNAKLKNVLPYWDAFPLVIPLKIYNNGFLGLNLHYIPPRTRRKFLTKLVPFANNPNGENRIRMRISYEMLKSAQTLNEYIPCLKRYLVDHVTSKLMRIYPHEWGHVIELPLAKWEKAPASRVYSESMRKIGK